eukprot:26455_1
MELQVNFPLHIHKNLSETRDRICSIDEYCWTDKDKRNMQVLQQLFTKNESLMREIIREHIYYYYCLLNVVRSVCFHEKDSFESISDLFFNEDPDSEFDLPYATDIDHWEEQCGLNIDPYCICLNKCMIQFWLTKYTYHEFLHKREIDIVSHSILYHRFLMYPQFIKYYFVKNINIFNRFSTVWCILVKHVHDKWIDEIRKRKSLLYTYNDEYYGDERKEEYMIDILVDLSIFIHYSIKYLKQYHLEIK